MARIRTIKPDFWTDEKIVELSPFARLLFIGLWNFADDDGRMECSPKRIKMQIFPSDPVECSELLGEIRRENLINIYIVDSIEYLQINGFKKHQKVDKRTASKYPQPPPQSENPAEFPRVPPTEGNGMEGKGRKEKLKQKEKNLNGKSRFIPPTPAEVGEFCRQRKNGIDPETFIAYYATRAWKLKGGVAMKDWKSAIITWEKKRTSTESSELPYGAGGL